MTIKRLTAAIIGLIIIALGIKALLSEDHELYDIEIYSGQLKVIENALDDEFGIAVDSPVLIRNVEEYVCEWDENDNEKEYFLKVPETLIFEDENTEMESNEKDSDHSSAKKMPPHSTRLESKTFFGKVQIGDSGLFLNDDVLRQLGNQVNLNFKNNYKPMEVTGLKDFEPILGFRPLDDKTFSSSFDNRWRDGDLKITWEAANPKAFAKLYTVGGIAKGDSLENVNGNVFFYDYPITKDEILAKYQGSSFLSSLIATIVGCVIFFLAVIPPIVRKIKK